MGLNHLMILLCACALAYSYEEDSADVELDTLLRRLLCQAKRCDVASPEKRNAYLVMKYGADLTDLKVNAQTTEGDQDCLNGAGCLFIIKIQDEKDAEVETVQKVVKNGDKMTTLTGLVSGKSYSVLTCRADSTDDGGWTAVEVGGKARCSCNVCTMGPATPNSLYAFMPNMCASKRVISISGRPACPSLIRKKKRELYV